MKKKLSILPFIYTFFISVLIAPFLIAFSEKASAEGLEAEAIIRFELDDASNPARDPDTDEFLDDGTYKEGTTGPLSLDYVSNWNFARHHISDDQTAYIVQKDTIYIAGAQRKVAPFVQITDKTGSAAGWILSVQQNGQFKAGKEELKGSVIRIESVSLSSKDDGNTPEGKKDIVLNPEGALVNVCIAGNEQGTGTWFGKFISEEKETVHLVVPKEAKKEAGIYKTSFTWTLANTPL